MSARRCAVLGGSGYLGHTLAFGLAALGWSVTATHHSARVDASASGANVVWKNVDVLCKQAVYDLLNECAPCLIVNTVAISDIAANERDPVRAASVNTPIHSAEWAKERQEQGRPVRYIHFSTDQVYDGTKAGLYSEADPPNPLHTYGRTKLSAEDFLLQTLTPQHLAILRISVIIGPAPRAGIPAHSTFLQWLHGELKKEGGALECFEDERRSFVYVMDLVRVCHALSDCSLGAGGVFMCGGTQPLSRCELAALVCDVTGAPADRIAPVRQALRTLPYPRPLNLCMDSSHLLAHTRVAMTDTRTAVLESLAALP